ncbi:hypothetical protein G7046_g7578 [Stylonectria norvegica]|nr:hypothetical protein G7046_g7578 [Stylonectria norvegica]
MDPVSAVGVVSAVLTFVDFTYKLVSVAKKISASAGGTTAEVQNVQTNMTRLNELCDNLERELQGHQGEITTSLRQLSWSCKQDCGKLLAITNKLQIRQGTTLFIAAWRTVNGNKKGAEIQARLEKTQTSMSLLVVTIIRSQVQTLEQSVEKLQKQTHENHLDQSSKLASMTAELQAMKFSFETLSVHMTQKLPSDLNELVEKLKNVISVETSIEKEQAILESLRFDSWPIRHDAISQAHDKTFEWAFKSELSAWLTSNGGIFWISGKAGSGKSTLMKFLVENPETRRLLSKQASSSDKVTIAAHYFWALGTPMQKSHKGLLQSLVYDILRQCREIIPQACPNRWNRADSRAKATSLRSEPWRESELAEVLHNISQARGMHMRFCFFIDGLDEFDGDQLALCQVLRRLTQASNIKLCVSSRPRNVFEDEFEGDGAKLYLHDLTHNDIAIFTKNQLQSHPRWESCYAPTLREKEYLILDLIRRSNGVFLWVVLVTRSLRDGVTNGDSIHLLQARLDSLPGDLEELFKRMLNDVDKIYHQHLSEVFLMLLENSISVQCWMMPFHRMELVDEDYYKTLKVDQSQLEKEAIKYDKWSNRQLKAISNGLLENVSGQIGFMHKSIADFLMTREINSYIKSECRSHFNPRLTPVKALVARLKTRSRTDVESRALEYIAEISTKLVPMSDRDFEALSEVFEEADRLFSDIGIKELWDQELRRMAMRYNLVDFVSYNLSRDPGYLDCLKDEIFDTVNIGLSAEMNTMLLHHGENSNQICHLLGGLSDRLSTTQWQECLSRLFKSVVKERVGLWSDGSKVYSIDTAVLGYFSATLAHGEQPNCDIELSTGRLTAFCMFLMIAWEDLVGRFISTDEYLRVLEAYITAGVNLNDPIELNGDERYFVGVSAPLGKSTVLGVFCQGLRSSKNTIHCLQSWEDDKTPELPKPSAQEASDFISAVTTRVIYHGLSSGCDLTELKESIELAFPSNVARGLLLQIELPPDVPLADLPRSASQVQDYWCGHQTLEACDHQALETCSETETRALREDKREVRQVRRHIRSGHVTVIVIFWVSALTMAFIGWAFRRVSLQANIFSL